MCQGDDGKDPVHCWHCGRVVLLPDSSACLESFRGWPVSVSTLGQTSLRGHSSVGSEEKTRVTGVTLSNACSRMLTN